MAYKITYTNKRKAADDIKGWWDDAPNVVRGKKSSEINRKNKTGMCFTDDKDKKTQWGRKGNEASKKISIENGGSGSLLIDWCNKNNHWEKLAEIHRDVPKSKEQKEKISKKLKGRKLPKETCEKMSQSKMGHGWSEETIDKLKTAARKRCVPISQFDLDGNWIKDWDGFIYVNETLGLTTRSIQLVCNYYRDNLTKGSKQCGGFIWKYK
jgi:hypothetical protein